MYNIYFYPKTNLSAANSPNPYISNFEKALSRRHTIVNTKYNSIGILDLFKHLYDTDIFIFNWIENLPMRRYGKLQILLFPVFLMFAKGLRRKITWVLHNKYSHHKEKNFWTDFVFKLMIKHSDLMITHSTAGIDFVTEHFAGYEKRVKYIIHPVTDISPKNGQLIEKKYDFLIWGTIYPYKGILEFLEFFKRQNSSQKVLILGKCFDQAYKDEIEKNISESIIYKDQLFSIEEIQAYARESKFTLFTYKPGSVLSSGVLMDAIRMRQVIIGPNHGAFKDLKHLSFVKTFEKYRDILSISEHYNPDPKLVNSEIEEFCKANSWQNFAQKLEKEIESL